MTGGHEERQQMRVERALPGADEVEVVDLDSLSTEELLAERAKVKGRIPMIAAQLQDKDRRPNGPEDDSAAWEAYRDWRRRARWAFAHHQRELVEIKAALSERQDAATAARAQRAAAGVPNAHDLAQQERGRRLRETLTAENDETLLLRTYRLIRHLLTEGEELPERLDTADRDALSMLSIRLRGAFGTGGLKAFVDTGGAE